MQNEDRREKLKEFYYSIKECEKCGLSKTRTNFVFGSGSAYTNIMLVGEAPGRNEDIQGKPFVGQAGKLLDELLSGIGFTRNDIFIANVLKCRPPQNRDPKTEEIDLCKHYLFSQIDIINPKIICTLGKHSTQLVLNTQEGITGLRGRVFKINNRIILPINHPAAALYTPSRMGILREDFRKMKEIFDSLKKSTESGEMLVLKEGTTKSLKTSVEKEADDSEEPYNDRKKEQLGLF